MIECQPDRSTTTEHFQADETSNEIYSPLTQLLCHLVRCQKFQSQASDLSHSQHPGDIFYNRPFWLTLSPGHILPFGTYMKLWTPKTMIRIQHLALSLTFVEMVRWFMKLIVNVDESREI